jgi:hypothetical protein
MTQAAVGPKIDTRRWFYHWMALTCLAISLIGFLPTYFVPMAQGAFSRPPLVHVHGLLFFAWIVFFVTQTWLAASGRVGAHRELGLLGVAIATAMGASIVAVAVMRVTVPSPSNAPPPLLLIAQILYFEISVAVALANVRRPETHKRLMLLATVSLLGAPIGRWWEIAFGKQIEAIISAGTVPGPTGMLLLSGPPMVASLVIFAAIVFDWRTRRQVSPVYMVGLPIFLLMGPILGPLTISPVGAAFDTWLKHLGG